MKLSQKEVDRALVGLATFMPSWLALDFVARGGVQGGVLGTITTILLMIFPVWLASPALDRRDAARAARRAAKATNPVTDKIAEEVKK